MKWAFGIVLVVVAGAVAAFGTYMWGWRDTDGEGDASRVSFVIAANRVAGLTEQGRLLRNFEALLFQTFGTREVSTRWREGLNFSCAGACAPNSDYQWYRLVFERPQGTTLRLSGRKVGGRLVAPTGYVEPVRVRGQFVACDRAETRFLVRYKTFESFTLGCIRAK